MEAHRMLKSIGSIALYQAMVRFDMRYPASLRHKTTLNTHPVLYFSVSRHTQLTPQLKLNGYTIAYISLVM
jgi:hypothetical protein